MKPLHIKAPGITAPTQHSFQGETTMKSLNRMLPFAVVMVTAAVATVTAQAAHAQERLTGSVTDAASGEALSGVHVDVLDAGGGEVGNAVTGPSGAYELSVPAGTYTVVFSAVGWETVTVESQEVAAGAEATRVSAEMSEHLYQLNPLTVSASRASEKVLDAPAAVEVVTSQELAERQAASPADHLDTKSGVDVARVGIRDRWAVLRGFNNVFSGATLVMTDNRIARVPSLRANLFSLVPSSDLDLEQVEIVLGPASALYGPNAANGVIHYLTKSPIDSPGLSFSAGGGFRQQGDEAGIGGLPVTGETGEVVQFDGRAAFAPSETFGFKVSGQYFDALEYAFDDVVEADTRAAGQACVDSGFDVASCQAFTAGLDLSNPMDVQTLQQAARNAVAGRYDRSETWNIDARVDWRPSPGTSVVLSGGRSMLGQGTVMTGLGSAAAQDWAVDYYQGRFSSGELFAQVFLNRNSSTTTHLLRSGLPLTDNSSLMAAQVQHSTDFGAAHRVVYGVDYLFTNPDSDGTINGRFEDIDQTREVGGYAQWEWTLNPSLELIGALRYDYNDGFENPVFSPRGALVYSPDRNSSLRLSFNRSYSTPSTNNRFLDVSGGTVPISGPFYYDLRATGTGSDGYQYMRDGDGLPMLQSPFNVLIGGTARSYLPTTTENMWAMAMQLAAAAAPPELAPLLALIPTPSGDVVGLVAALLDVETAGSGTPGEGCLAGVFCERVDLSSLQDVDPLDQTISNTLEVGYKGLIGRSASIGVSAWWTQYENWISPLHVLSPAVFLDQASTQGYLRSVFAQFVGTAFESIEVANATADGLASIAAGIPLGSVNPTSVGGTNTAMALGYSNAGGFTAMGAEISGGVLLSDNLEFYSSVSFVDKDEFEIEDSDQVVSLNAPTFKAAAALTYRADSFNGGLRFRTQSDFPFASAAYVGDMEAITTLDANAGYKIPGADDMHLQIDVSNLFDSAYQSFAGAPVVGRTVLARVRWDIGSF